MLHNYDITDGCGPPSSVNGGQPFLHGLRRISSGNFGSLTPEADSFSTDSHWPHSDVIPDYPSDDEMTSQVKRLQTFRNWPSSCPVKPKELAAAGFYYTGVGDTVRCFRCDLTLRQWEPGDNPWEDHKRHKSHCPFVRENATANRYDITPTTEETSSSNLFRSQQTCGVASQGNRDVSPGNVTSEKGSVPSFSWLNLQRQVSSQITEERTPGSLLESSVSIEETSFRKGSYQESSYGATNPSGYYSYRQQVYPTACESTEQKVKFTPGQSNASFRSLQAKEGITTVANQPPSSLQPEQMNPAEQSRMSGPIPGVSRMFQLNPGSQVSITSGGQGAVRVTSQPLYPQGQANQQEVQGLRAGPSPMHPAEMNTFIHSSSQGSPCFQAQSGTTGREAKPSRIPAAPVNRERPRQMANVAYPVVDPTLEEGPLFRQEDARHVSTSADLASEHHRLTTFVDWPQDSPVRPWELSVAGFYFVGTGDSVRCFKCGVVLSKWEPDDTPWREHRKWSPQCPLVLLHFRGRAQMGPVESTSGVPQGHQSYSQFQPTPPQSTVRRRSPPLSRPVWTAGPGSGSSEPTMPHSTPSSRATSFRTVEAPGYPSSGTYTHSSPGSLLGQEVRHSDVPLSGPPAATSLSTPGHLPALSRGDLERVVSMGFEREQVNQVICRRITSTGGNFNSLDELLQAVLTSLPPRVTAASEPSLSHVSIESTLPALPLENEEIPSGGPASSPNSPSPRIEGLRRTMSAPLGGLSGGAEAEKDESLQQKLDRMQEERTCKICMDAEVGMVFLPCGHLSCCPGCASGMEQCPMCRSPIHEKIRTYLS